MYLLCYYATIYMVNKRFSEDQMCYAISSSATCCAQVILDAQLYV